METRKPWIFSLTLAFAAAVACSPIRVPPFPPTPAAVVGRTISRADALADLDALMHTLEDVHPDLYAVRSRDAVSQARRSIVAGLPDSMTRAEWWIRLAPFVAGFGDGHTNVSYPYEELVRSPEADSLLFPVAVAVDDNRHLLVTAVFDRTAALKRGDRILQVNGHDADSLLKVWTGEFRGESDIYRSVAVADAFRDLLLIHRILAPYAVRVARADGAERGLDVPGISREALRALIRPGLAARGGSPNFNYRALETGIGYVNLRSLGGDLPRFKTDVAAMFRQVAADRDQTLIIDVRNNGGGDSRLGDELLRYITTKPYRSQARKQWKMSREYRAYLKSFLRPPLRWLTVEHLAPQGRALFSGPDGRIVITEEKLIAPVRAEPFFSGTVYLLIGPRTFSSAADLADAMKTYRLATLIGDETGGRPNGFGEVYPFRLPRSGFAVSVSSANFVRASGDTTDHRGVVPTSSSFRPPPIFKPAATWCWNARAICDEMPVGECPRLADLEAVRGTATCY